MIFLARIQSASEIAWGKVLAEFDAQRGDDWVDRVAARAHHRARWQFRAEFAILLAAHIALLARWL